MKNINTLVHKHINIFAIKEHSKFYLKKTKMQNNNYAVQKKHKIFVLYLIINK